MKPLAWNEEKNKWLKSVRKISFEDVAKEIEALNYLDDIPHQNKEKYAHQRMWIVEIRNYVFLVPYVEDADKYFLKSIIPSRKAKKKYSSKRKEHV